VEVVAWLVGDFELAGKLISILSSTLLIIPLYWTAHRLVGRRAAVYASLFYLANSIAGRWGIRVMSDSLFALLFFSSIILSLSCIESHLWAFKSLFRAQQAGLPDEDRSDEGCTAALIGGSVLGALALMTRLHGFLALLMTGFALVTFAQRRRVKKCPPRAQYFAIVLAWMLPWVAALVFNERLLAGHSKQIMERAGETFGQGLLNYGNLAESFVLLFPYFITIPVFVLFAVGLALFLIGDRARRVFGWAFLVFAAIILAMQSVFSSFQSRYLLPLVPFMMVLAGAAAARWEERAVRHLVWVRTVLVAILIYSFAWTAGVLVLQRGVFGDIKQAAQYCSSLPPEARIFSNETYKPTMPAIKMSYWSGRRVEGLEEASEPLAKGDYVCLHSAYGGLSHFPTLAPALRLDQQMELLRRRHEFEEVAWFEAGIVPLLPDVMENPDTHQNPAAWFYRYQRQRFRTVVLRITGVRPAR